MSSQEEAFLVTLGAQLALVVTNWQDWQGTDHTLPRIFSGLRGAPGIGIGVVQLCDDTDLISVVEAPSHDKEQDIERIFSNGADEYLAKPFKVDQLLEKVHELIGKGRTVE